MQRQGVDEERKFVGEAISLPPYRGGFLALEIGRMISSPTGCVQKETDARRREYCGIKARRGKTTFGLAEKNGNFAE